MWCRLSGRDDPDDLLAVLFEKSMGHQDNNQAPNQTHGLPSLPSRPGEFHPEPLTEPCMTVSRHTARATLEGCRLPPQPPGSSCCQLAKSIATRVTCPLRSTGITPLHRYYGTVRPCPTYRYFRPRGATACAFSLITAEQVLKFRTRAKVRVTPPVPRTPHGQYAGFRHALPGERGRSGFDATSRSVSRPHQWFTCIRLSNSHMT